MLQKGIACWYRRGKGGGAPKPACSWFKGVRLGTTALPTFGLPLRAPPHPNTPFVEASVSLIPLYFLLLLLAGRATHRPACHPQRGF